MKWRKGKAHLRENEIHVMSLQTLTNIIVMKLMFKRTTALAMSF